MENEAFPCGIDLGNAIRFILMKVKFEKKNSAVERSEYSFKKENIGSPMVSILYFL